MEALAILREAEQAGLKLRVEGDTLVVSGPSKAEPIVRRLAECKAEVVAALVAPEHPWVLPSHMRRLDWPAGGWQELHATLLNLWSAPRRDTFGTISLYTPDAAACVAFSDLCDCWRRHHLREEKDGTRARIEAAKALAEFGVVPPRGWAA